MKVKQSAELETTWVLYIYTEITFSGTFFMISYANPFDQFLCSQFQVYIQCVVFKSSRYVDFSAFYLYVQYFTYDMRHLYSLSSSSQQL